MNVTLAGIPIHTIVAILIASLALFITTRNYWRKSGLKLRGSFTSASSVDCEDRFVSSYTIENMKDRTVTIYAIYLRLSHNYYVMLKDFENTPLQLKPYETFHEELGPIQFYSINLNSIDLNSHFNDEKTKKQLVLSTSAGKYVITSRIRRWSPLSDFFKNFGTGIIQPQKLIYKDKFIGGNVRFVVDLTNSKNESEIITILPDDYRHKVFRNFRLTEKSLQSLKSLEDYLKEQQLNGQLPASVKFDIFDAFEWRKRFENDWRGIKKIKAQHFSFSKYYIWGRIGTYLYQRKTEKNNKERLKKANP